jgi:hypothetical protein
MPDCLVPRRKITLTVISVTIVDGDGERTLTYDPQALQKRQRRAQQHLWDWLELSKTDVCVSMTLQMILAHRDPSCRCLGVERQPLGRLPAWRERSAALIRTFPADAGRTFLIFQPVLFRVTSTLLRPLPFPTLVSVEVKISADSTGYDNRPRLSINVRESYSLRSLGVYCMKAATAAYTPSPAEAENVLKDHPKGTLHV